MKFEKCKCKKQVVKDIVARYTESMKDIGLMLKSGSIKRIITVTKYYNMQTLRVNRYCETKTPTGRGFLKKREGSTYDITNYLEVEYEVMA